MASKATAWWESKPDILRTDDFSVGVDSSCEITIQTPLGSYKLTGRPRTFAALGKWLTNTFYDPEGDDA